MNKGTVIGVIAAVGGYVAAVAISRYVSYKIAEKAINTSRDMMFRACKDDLKRKEEP